MAIVAFAVFDAAGSPLSGLTPVFINAFDADTEIVTAFPTITDIGGGLYVFTIPPEDLTGVIDAGATATPRFFGVSAEDVGTVVAFTAGAGPLTGLTPVWSVIVDGGGTPFTPQPTFTELGSSGIYKFDFPTIAQSEGIIDFGATANPRFVFFSRLNPAPGSAPSFSDLETRVTDGGNAYRIRP